MAPKTPPATLSLPRRLNLPVGFDASSAAFFAAPAQVFLKPFSPTSLIASKPSLTAVFSSPAAFTPSFTLSIVSLFTFTNSIGFWRILGIMCAPRRGED